MIPCRIPDFFDLTVFQRVARSGSMSKAAAGLGIAQPTVSARVGELEDELGVSLFRRTARGAELTEAGRRFLAYADRCLSLLAEGRQAAREEHDRLTLRLAAPASLAETLYPRLAPVLVERKLDLWLSTNHSPEVLEMLLDGRIDAGICLSGPTMPTIESLPLRPIAIRCVARSDHPLAGLPARSYGLADLASYTLAIFEWGREVEDLWERLVFASGRRVPTAYAKVSPAEVARKLVLDQGAISFLPELAVEADLSSGEAVQLRPAGLPRYSWPLMLVHRKRKQPAPAFAVLLEVIAGLR